MNDRAIGLLDQYDIEVLRTRKGRGAILCDTEKGVLIFMEYQGPKAKVKLQSSLLEQIGGSGVLPVEQIVPTREGELLVQDGDGISYILKTHFEGRECNFLDMQDCLRGVRTLAKLHSVMRLGESELTEQAPVYLLEKEYEKHNRELTKVRRFLSEKRQKNGFERYLLQEYDYFLDQAGDVLQQWKDFVLPEDYAYLRREGIFCHGDYQYHNIIDTGSGQAVIHFERCIMDDQIRDLYLFMRKLLEKSCWSRDLGERLLQTYSAVQPLSARSFVALYYRLAYPEKFWKIANFYYNSGKAWIPEKNMEKLQKVVEQERAKQAFLDGVFRRVSV